MAVCLHQGLTRSSELWCSLSYFGFDRWIYDAADSLVLLSEMPNRQRLPGACPEASEQSLPKSAVRNGGSYDTGEVCSFDIDQLFVENPGQRFQRARYELTTLATTAQGHRGVPDVHKSARSSCVCRASRDFDATWQRVGLGLALAQIRFWGVDDTSRQAPSLVQFQTS